MTDVRKRTLIRTWYEVRFDCWKLVRGTLCEAREVMRSRRKRLGRANEGRIVKVSRYRIERPVLTEVRVDEGDRVTRYAASTAVFRDGLMFEAWSNGHRLTEPTTRAAAERACRKYLRGLGYRVQRAEGT